MACHIYLIRHGETDWNRLRKLQGHTDIPLNETGRLQAKKIARKLSSYPIKYVYASDLSRAKDTASEIARFHQAPLGIAREFRERFYGEWEGLHWEEITDKYPDHSPGQQLGGKYGIETIENMQKRGIGKLLELVESHPDGHIAIVSHGGMINALLHAWSKGEHGIGKTKLGNTSFNHISFADGEWILHKVNDISHLEMEDEQ